MSTTGVALDSRNENEPSVQPVTDLSTIDLPWTDRLNLLLSSVLGVVLLLLLSPVLIPIWIWMVVKK